MGYRPQSLTNPIENKAKLEQLSGRRDGELEGKLLYLWSVITWKFPNGNLNYQRRIE
jgi:hypothetical protein